MNGSGAVAEPRLRPDTARLALALCVGAGAAAAYCWLPPLWRPRGAYLGGHYRLVDVYVGVPAVLSFLVAVAFLQARTAMRRRQIARLGLAVALFLGTLLTADAGIALLLGREYWFDSLQLFEAVHRTDPVLGFRGRPSREVVNTRRVVEGRGVPRVLQSINRTDGQGFRNPPGVRLRGIVFLGDSYTHAVDIPEEQTFVRLVGRRTGLPTVNLGWIGYGPQQELIVLERFGLPYAPRWVVWQLFEGNDLVDARRFARWKRDPRPPAMPPGFLYVTRSPLVRLLNRTQPPRVRPDPGVRLRYPNGTQRTEDLLHPYYADLPEREPEGMAITLASLTAGWELCRSRGIRLLVVVVPVPVRALAPVVEFRDPAARRRLLPHNRTDAPTDFCTAVTTRCRRLGCAVVDLTSPLRERSRENPDILLPTDGHLDVEGHRVATDAVIRKLSEPASVPVGIREDDIPPPPNSSR